MVLSAEWFVLKRAAVANVFHFETFGAEMALGGS